MKRKTTQLIETERYEIHPFSYYIKNDLGAYTIWRNGCRIGTSRENGDVWEFKTKDIQEARDAIHADAKRQLSRRIKDIEAQRRALAKTLRIIASSLPPISKI